jgi:diguanylate cyclase (GGDEF)-like protein
VDYILQLGLNKLRKSDRRDPIVPIVWLIDQLLEVIAENLSGEDADRNSFRFKLETCRRAILESHGEDISGLTALSTLDLCRGQFKKLQTHRQERDEHLAEIIQFLRKSMSSLTGDSRAFHEDLLGTIGRISEHIDLKDMHELKSRVARETSELNQVITEKQKREQFQFSQFSEQISILQHKLKVAKAEAFLDGLTGIANRRNFDFTIERWLIAHEKSEDPFTLAIFGLDSLKQTNDNYGHQIGDQVLMEIAMELGRNVRAKDYLARFGGEEFVILSAGMKLMESEKRFSEMLKHIEKMQCDCKNAENETLAVFITTSCGIAEYVPGENTRDLIKRTEEALYEAKQAGKNRVATKRRPLLGAFYEGRRRNSIA